jgi:gamma-glutamylcyclotransferase (GGCT)/AIG2-like uncharacterized protein YtfP
MNKIFVYGTLRNGMLQQVVPTISSFVHAEAKGFVSGRLFDTGEFPAATPANLLSSRVYGEVIKVDDSKLEKVLGILDDYEEIDKKNVSKSLFRRKLVEVNVAGGEKVKAWIYWYNKDVKGFKELKSGIYRRRKIAI